MESSRIWAKKPPSGQCGWSMLHQGTVGESLGPGSRGGILRGLEDGLCS